MVPFDLPATRFEPSPKLLDQDQRQEAAEDVAADRLVALVEVGPGLEDRLDAAEELLEQ